MCLLHGRLLLAAGLLLMPNAHARAAPAPEEGKTPRTDRQGDPLPKQALARLGTVRLRHGHSISALAFSADGKLLASTAADHTTRLWDPATGKELLALGKELAAGDIYGGDRWRTIVALSPDGKLLAFSSNAGIVHLHETATGKLIRTFPGHGNPIISLAFSPDGKTLAASGYNTVQLWSVEKGALQLQLAGRLGFVRSLAFSPDGKLLAASNQNGPVHLWELATRKLLIDAMKDPSATCLAFSRDGKHLALGSGSALHLWQVDPPKALRTFAGHQGAVAGVAFAPDGKTLISAAAIDTVIRIWDVATGKESRTFERKPGTIDAVALSPDGKTLALAGEHAAIHLLDVATGKELRLFGAHQAAVEELAFAPDGKTLRSDSRDRDFRFWDLATTRATRHLSLCEDGATAGVFDPKGEVVATGGADGVIRLRAAGSGKLIRTLKGHGNKVLVLRFTADGKRLASGGADGRIGVWDPVSGEEVYQMNAHPGGVQFLAFAPDGKILASAGATDQQLRFWDAATGKPLHTAAPAPGPLASLAFSADGKRLATGGKDSSVRLWDAATGKQVRQLAGLPGYIMAVAFAADGRTLAVGGWMNVRLYELATQSGPYAEFLGHQGDVQALAFAADGRVLASGSSDTTILLWDVTGRSPTGQLQPPELSAEQRAALWTDLASAEARRAQRAVWTLTAEPGPSVAFIKEHLRAPAAVDPKQVARLIADLDDDQVDVREKATEELAGIGKQAEPALREALKKGPASAEVRLRLNLLLERLDRGVASPELLRSLRVVQVLEQVGTPEARQLLKTLSQQRAAERVGEEARAALERLTRRAAERS